MKKIFNIIIVAILVVINFSSCQVGNGFKGVERTFDDIKLDMTKTKYPRVANNTIISEEFGEVLQCGGQYIKVTYRYGERYETARFFKDINGKVVRIREIEPKQSGYPHVQTVFQHINSKGIIVFNYGVVILGLIIVITYKNIFSV